MIRPGLAVGAAAIVLLSYTAGASADTWPMFHHDAGHLGVSAETAISSTTAASLGIRWEVNTGDKTYASPSVATSSVLGRDLVYVGNEAGVMSAYDAVNGARVWWHRVGASINSSAAANAGSVWFGSSDHYLYALNAANGSQRCRFTTAGVVSSSPVIGNPDGLGRVVYVGDNGQTGADDGGDMWAVNASNCSLRWRFNQFGDPPGSQPLVGSWSPPALAKTASGRSVVIFGSSSPEGAVYCLDASTGALLWRFQTQLFSLDQDVGAGPTVSPPGANGFADGVVYVAGKDNIVYALDLGSGAPVWSYDLSAATPGLTGAVRSTAALLGRTLYVGYGVGVIAIDAVTGARVWSTTDLGAPIAEVIASPAISGPAGSRVLLAADSDGTIHAFDLTDGAELWQYATGSTVYSSVALADGAAYATSSNGFLYSFAPGGPVSGSPDTTVTYPTAGQIQNPNGNLLTSGTAVDDSGVASVLVAVRMNGLWWDAAAQGWSSVFTSNPALLTDPGSPATSWSFAFPVPSGGGPAYLQAEAVDDGGQHDPTVAAIKFSLTALGSPPDTTIASPVFKQVFHFPTNPDGTVDRVSFPVAITGSAADSGGVNVGIRKVTVLVENIEHAEYYCGAGGCPGQPGVFWRATYTTFSASLAAPGAQQTAWSATFPVYDHPHKYRIAAWALDLDGQADPSHALVSRICVRDPGDSTCF